MTLCTGSHGTTSKLVPWRHTCGVPVKHS